MSGLPKYQRIADEERGYDPACFTLGVDDAEAITGYGDGEGAPTYPPVASQSQEPGQKKRVELWLLPRWPLRGSDEVVLGTLGATREVCSTRSRGLVFGAESGAGDRGHYARGVPSVARLSTRAGRAPAQAQLGQVAENTAERVGSSGAGSSGGTRGADRRRARRRDQAESHKRV